MVNQEHINAAKRVSLVLMDCDGVLTDGKLYYGESGELMKAFHVHDGYGIKRWHEQGYKSGIITGRSSQILENRSKELGVEYLIQNSNDKVDDGKRLIDKLILDYGQVAYIGDDELDLPLLQLVGFPAIVSNSLLEDKLDNPFRTKKQGGEGAIRELLEFILNSKID